MAALAESLAGASPARRVAILLPELRGGGLERVMSLLGGELARRGTRVEFLVCGRATGGIEPPPGTHAQLLARAGAGRARLSLALAGGPGASLPGVLPGQAGVLAALERYLARERPHALIAAALTPNLLAIHARRRAPATRTILTVHNTLSEQLRHQHRDAPFKHYAKRLALPGLLRRACLSADAVVAVSNGVAGDLARTLNLPRERITMIYNPVVDDHLLAASRAPCPHPWLEAGAAPVIIGFGRLAPRKRFDLLIEAHAALRPRCGQRLVIIGEGDQRAALERHAVALGVADSVHFTGRVENPFAWLSRGAVMACCSQYEGFGLVLVEALACGSPVVSTACPHGPAEILDGGRFGRLVPVDDVAALTDALARTLAAPPDRAALRARGMEFSVERAADRYLALLEGAPA